MEKKDIKQALDKFNNQNIDNLDQDLQVIKQDKSLIEVHKLTKKIITEDGRQLLT